MSYFQNVYGELINLKNYFKGSLNINNQDTVKEILSLIIVFGETINSSTKNSLKELKDQKNKHVSLQDEDISKIYNKLLILIEEYKQVILNNNQTSRIISFEVNQSKIVLVVDEHNVTHFFEESEEYITGVTSSIDDQTEAIILIGVGSYDIANYLNRGYKVLVVEPYDYFPEIDSQYVVYSNEKDFNNKLNEKLLELIGLKTEIIVHPLYPHTTNVVKVMREVRDLFHKMRLDLNTRVLHTGEWYEQYFLNANFLEKRSDKIFNVDFLDNFHAGERGLMIAGGPSLEDALPYLKWAQNSYYIVAIGQTVKVLLENGVVPDYVVSLDSQKVNAHFFKEVKLERPLIFPLQVNYEIPLNAKGVLIPFPNNEITKSILSYSNNFYSTAPTVAISAVMFMNFMGFSSIGLIGQDLALKDGEYYSSSVKEKSATDGQLSNETYEVTLNSGKLGKTTPVLFNFLSNYETLLKDDPDLLLKLQNYATDGAKIADVPLYSLDSLSKDVIVKREIKLDSKDSLYKTIKLNETYKIIEEVGSDLKEVLLKFKRMSTQKAITTKEFDLSLAVWDQMLEIPNFKSFVMPLQVVKMLIVQNKIQLHNHLNQNSQKRIEILKLMYNTVESFINQINLILDIKKSNY